MIQWSSWSASSGRTICKGAGRLGALWDGLSYTLECLYDSMASVMRDLHFRPFYFSNSPKKAVLNRDKLVVLGGADHILSWACKAVGWGERVPSVSAGGSPLDGAGPVWAAQYKTLVCWSEACVTLCPDLEEICWKSIPAPSRTDRCLCRAVLHTAPAVTQPASVSVHPALPLDLLLAGCWSLNIFSAVGPWLGLGEVFSLITAHEHVVSAVTDSVCSARHTG